MRDRFIDALERVAFILLAANFYNVFLRQVDLHPHYILLMLGETLGLLFVLFRPWGRPIATKPYTIFIALMGSIFPLLVQPVGYQPAFVTIGGLIMALGVSLTIAGKVALNRRFGMIAANRGVQIAGPYAIVRHPIYAGYTVTHIGFLITNPAWWNIIVYAMALAFQILRIIEEERYLREDPSYDTYASAVRYRLIPGLF
jgi:protein-S-isoprenylcysteine O-methyltransferase Ste14